ncbi:S10 family peptidase [Allomuricauda sp. NBRC 101325]|uniref:S10 family peptidase n=1 Tax=Allomuricauda sp. NBRC 101325 TaxID=1113758 RepID=UPI0024A07185|nr:carboxypeptidase [Muricauda sp. NBRC 101325]GLU44852.1 carboxypeptidase [Muricauda sp. NBRC 101325]
MKRLLLILMVGVFSNGSMFAQKKIPINIDSSVTTKATVTIKGKTIPYTATAGKQPVWDEDGNAIAGLFYVYYKRSDINDTSKRPLVFSFNGGPGAASVWMHLGYTGPRRILISEEGYPVQPYGVEENHSSILDVADIVYVEPVNTGLSRPVDGMRKEDVEKTFFGVNADIKYLARWIKNFVTRQDRWPSPKFLVGESYGTTRVSGLARELQERQWMYLNGVVLVSPTTLGIRRDGPVADANMLPYYAATAWFHKKMPSDLQQKDLTDMLPEVEGFTVNELIPALTKGGLLPLAEKKSIASKMSRYSGISEKVIMEHNLRIPARFFWKELLRDQGYTIGRLDSRYLGIDKVDSGESPDYSPENTSWQHTFTPAINYYLKNYLNYNTDLDYYIAGHTRPWDRNDDHTGEDLGRAMSENPYLHVMVQSGYYDGACDYYNAKYNMWQIDQSGKLMERMRWRGYRSGHMMYLRSEDLIKSNDDLREFIKDAIPSDGAAAEYLHNGLKIEKPTIEGERNGF